MTMLRLSLLALAAIPVTALAHHSFSAYNTTGNIELEGDVASVSWRNPLQIQSRYRQPHQQLHSQGHAVDHGTAVADGDNQTGQ